MLKLKIPDSWAHLSCGSSVQVPCYLGIKKAANPKGLPPVKYKKPFMAVFRQHPLGYGYNYNYDRVYSRKLFWAMTSSS